MKAPKKFADFLSNPPGGWRGTFSLLGFGVIGNIVASILTLFAENSLWLLIFWLIVVLLLLWGLFATRQQLAPKHLVPPHRKPQQHRGLIVLVSKGRPTEPDRPLLDQAAFHAIQYHQPVLEACWLVASSGEGGSLTTAMNLENEFADSAIRFHIRTVGDAFDVEDTYRVIENIYLKELAAEGLQPEEVIADFTGGVKPMSAGVVLLCGMRLPMQYMYGHNPKVASEPVLVRFTP